MSNPNEQEKLTPASRKSYDGSGTNMAESDAERDEHPEKDDEEEKSPETQGDNDGGNDSEIARPKDEKEGLVKSLLKFLMSSNDESNAEQRTAAFYTLIRFSVSNDEPPQTAAERDEKVAEGKKTEQQVDDFANLVMIFATPERLHPHSKREDEEKVDAANDIYDELLDVGDVLGFDKGTVSELVAVMAEKEPLVTEEDRFKKLDEYFKDKVDRASEEALETLKSDIGKLKGKLEAGSETHKSAEETETALEKILKEVEEQRNQTDDIDAQDRKWLEEYAKMVARVFQTLPDLRDKEIREYKLDEDETAYVERVVGIIVAPEGQNEKQKKQQMQLKQNIVSALLAEELRLTHDPEDRNEAIRKEILKQAKKAGLDTSAIEVDEIFDEVNVTKVNELEALYEQNTFEELVEKQILNAEADDVKKVRDAWLDILHHAEPESDEAAYAREAINVLGDIITFKEEKNKADARGEQLDRRKLAKPKLLELEEAENDKRELQDDADAKELFIEKLVALYASTDPKIIEQLTKYLILTGKNFDDQFIRISKLLASLPKKTEPGILGVITTTAASYGLFVEPVVNNEPSTEKERKTQLQELIKECLEDGTAYPLIQLQESWADLLQSKVLEKDDKNTIEDALQQIEKLLPTKRSMSLEQAVDAEVTQTDDYVRSMTDSFIEHPSKIKGQESGTVEALVYTTLARFLLEDGSYENGLSEQAIARLLLLFPGEGQVGAGSKATYNIRRLILKYADALGLQDNKILHQISELSNKSLKEGEPERLSARKAKFEALIRESLEKANAKQLRSVETLWAQMGFVEDKDDSFQEYVQHSQRTIENVVLAKEVLASQLDNDRSKTTERAKVKDKYKDEFPEKSFTLVLETHDDERIVEKLTAWRDSIEARIEAHPEGKIAVLLEDGTITKAESKAITKAIEKGAKPSSELPAHSAYIKTRNELLDELCEKYKGRLHIITEWRPEDHKGSNVPDISGIRSKDDITNSAVAELQEQVLEHAKLMKKRNELMARMVAEALDSEDVVGGIGLVGSAHTPVGYTLKKQGYTIDRVLSDKEGSTMLFNPYAAYVRGLELVPDKKPDDDELKLVLQAELMFNAAYPSYSNEQELLKEIYGWMQRERKRRKNPDDRQADSSETQDRKSSPQRNLQPELARMFSKQSPAWTPVPVAGKDQYGRRGGTDYYDPERDGNSAETLEQVSAAAVQQFAGRDDLRDVQQIGKDVNEAVQPVGRRASEQDIQAKRAQIESLSERLKEQISQSIREDQSDNTVAIRNIPGVMQLHSALMAHREALAKMEGYEGLIRTKSEMDPDLYEGYVHTVLDERMRRIRVFYNQEQPLPKDLQNAKVKYTEKDIIAYYNELQRWAGILVGNDFRRNPEIASKKDTLRLSNQRYERFLQIAEQRNIMKMSAADRERIMLADIDYMYNENNTSGGDFLRYFQQNAPDPERPGQNLGVFYQRPADEGAYQPESLHATMRKIAQEFGAQYETGGERELINAEGEFQYQNFVYWIRTKIMEDVDYNRDGPINPYGKINIKLDMGQISMYEMLLLIPEYTSQRRFDIKMQNGKQDEVYSGWGAKVENPEFKWPELDLIAMEMEFRQMTHDLRKDFTATSVSNNKEQYLGLMKKLHHNNHWTRGSNIFLLLGYPAGSAKNAKQEFDDWKDESIAKQGSLGKAMSDMLVSYYYLSELTDFHKTKMDEHGNPSKVEREKNFNENMFYRFLEPDGANKFLIKMAEGALQENRDARIAYANFIRKRMQAATERYVNDESLGLSDDQKRTIIQIRNEYRPDVKEENLEIDFKSNDLLANFYKLVQENVLNDKQRKQLADREKKKELNVALQVKKDLVENLKKEYFRRLYDMQVGKVTSKSSNRYLMTDGTIRFGDIEVSEGRTMQQFLESFDMDQIWKFDFVSSDPEDDNNPFKDDLGKHKDLLRRKIDAFMDPTKNARNYELFKANEKMMLEFTRHIARIDRKDLNHFRDAEELSSARDMIQRSFQHVFGEAYGIDKAEQQYAWWWVRDYVYLWGIGAMLDCDGIGFRWDGKLMGTGRWRPRRQGKDGGGNPHTFDEFLALSMDFLHHVQVTNIAAENEPLGHRPIFYWLQGGDGGNITPRAVREFDKRSNYKFQQNIEALYVDNTLENSSEFLDLVAKTEFEVKHIVSTDPNGKVIYDYAKAREIFGKWRKAARYAFGKNGIDYREKIWVNGREKTMYEHFFGPKTRALNELIFRELKDAGVHTENFKYKDPADAILLSIVAAEVAEHRSQFGSGHQWTIDDILQLERFLLDFMTESAQSEDEYGVITSKPKWGTLFSRQLFASALKAYHTAYYKMYGIELNQSFWSGIMVGLGEGIKDFFTKGKWIW